MRCSTKREIVPIDKSYNYYTILEIIRNFLIFDSAYNNNYTNYVQFSNFYNLLKLTRCTKSIKPNSKFYTTYNNYVSTVENLESDFQIRRAVSCNTSIPIFENMNDCTSFDLTNQIDKSISLSKKDNCCICMESKQNKEFCTTKCGHKFCTNDINMLFTKAGLHNNIVTNNELNTKISCPMCRCELSESDIIYNNHKIGLKRSLKNYLHSNLSGLDIKSSYIYKWLLNLSIKELKSKKIYLIICNCSKFSYNFNKLANKYLKSFRKHLINARIVCIYWSNSLVENTSQEYLSGLVDLLYHHNEYNNVVYNKINVILLSHSFMTQTFERNFMNAIYFIALLFRNIDIIKNKLYIFKNIIKINKLLTYNLSKCVINNLLDFNNKDAYQLDINIEHVIIKNTIDEKIYDQQITFIKK